MQRARAEWLAIDRCRQRMGLYSYGWGTHIVDTMVNTIRSFRYLIVISALLGILFVPLGDHNVEATIAIAHQGIELAAAHNTAEGAWSDGTTMWVLSDGQDKLSAYDLVSGTRKRSQDIQLHSWNGSPQGIWSDGNIMWVADWDDTKLYAYNLDDGTRQDDRDINLTGRNDGPRGVAGAGEIILVVDKDDTWVYAYNSADGTRQEDAEFNLHGDNRNPWGIWAADSTVWISDIGDDILYAYTTLTATFSNAIRDEAREIRLPLDNGQPRGIWSDGETMWVVDDYDNYVYAMYYLDFRHVDDEFGIDEVNEPTGLWTDGDTAWVADAGRPGAGKLFAYGVSNGLRRSNKDVQLESANDNPVAVWSDGSTVWVAEDESGAGNEFLYAYALDHDPNEQQLLQSGLSILLDSDNSSPAGVWSDGDTIWVSDSGDDKLYAYDLSGHQRLSAEDITLVSPNADPGGIWGDGRTIWVLDTVDKHVYAYSRGQGTRKPAKEFRPAPANDDLSGGLAGHGLRLWLVDSDDEKVYAYGKVNTPPTFEEPSARFNIHYSLGGDGYVGPIPAVAEPDGDPLTFTLSGSDADSFTLDAANNHLRTKPGTTDFSGGDNFSLTISVTDQKSGLDGFDDSEDDAINVTVHVDHNGNPEFSPLAGSAFTVDENIASDHVIAEVDITDLDVDDDLFVELSESGSGTTPPFMLELKDNGARRDGEIKLRQNESLDFESQASYAITLSVSDRKNEDGESDPSVDDEIQLTINVSNVDETGSLSLSTAEPQVGTAMSVTLSDPDGVNLESGQQITWKVERSSDQSTWTPVSTTNSGNLAFEYTPVTADARHYQRFTATYKDKYDTNDKAATLVTGSAVLAEPPANGAPSFFHTGNPERRISEDAEAGTNVGSPIAATDPENDTLTFQILNSYSSRFSITNTGQIQLESAELLNFEYRQGYFLRVWVRDNKDRDDMPDTAWDVSTDVQIWVDNVDEPGRVRFRPGDPRVDLELHAKLTDPDGSVTNRTWQWQNADNAEPVAWTDIAGATSASYTPVSGDIGKYLRAKVSYDDGEGTGKEASGTTGNAVASNQPPEFDEGATTMRSVPEGATAGTRVGAAVTATDSEGHSLAYSLASGGHSHLFAVEPATGRLEVAREAILDYESASSLAAVLQVSDANDANYNPDNAIDDTITVTIDLLNVDEPGSVKLPPGDPKVDLQLLAGLTDPDGSVANVAWQWQNADTAESATWADITGATSASYTPVSGDVGKYLRAKASYDDGEGTGKEASGTIRNAVSSNQPPEFDEGAATLRSVAEGATAGTGVGAAVTATDSEGHSLAYSLASGGHSHLFVVEPATGRLEVAQGAVLDYESTPTLEVVLQVSDSRDANYNPDNAIDDTITVTIDLLNVDEPGSVTISPPETEVDTSLTASLTDPDGGITAATWHWDKSQDATNWTTISGASSVTYTPVSGDVGMYLRAVATYTDNQGPGKTASAATAGTVQAKPVVDTSLDSLTLGGIPFTFTSTILEYSLNVPNTKKRTKVTANPAVSSGVSVEITPADSRPNRNGHQVELAVGETTITITVSEGQGSLSTTYTVRVTRASAQPVDPPPSDPQQAKEGEADDESETEEEPSPEEQCRNDWAGGLLAECIVTRFAVVRVEHDGSYNINWSEWDSDNPQVTGYTITKNKFIYKTYKDDNGTVSDATLASVYDNCQFVDDRWTCEGPALVNLFEDWDGNPTQPVELATNADITEWSSSLDAAGRHVADETFHLWSGDATDVNNTPTSVTYRTISFDTHIYYFSKHEGSQSSGRDILSVNGANGFDEI